MRLRKARPSDALRGQAISAPTQSTWRVLVVVTTSQVLIDTGPLVALYDRKDQHHNKCAEAASEIAQPAYTCWPVITEAAYLLRDFEHAVRDMLSKIEKGELRLMTLGSLDASGINAILDKYRFGFADSCLMYLAEREDILTVFTVDYRHFSLYRTANGKSLRLLPEN